MKNTWKLLLALLAFLVTQSASASDLLYESKPAIPVYNTGPYFGVTAGFNFQDGITGYVNPTTGGTADLNTGYDASARLGWTFNNFGPVRPRAEIEGFYLTNDLDSVQAFNAGGPTGTPFGIDGNYSAYGVCGNALFDIKVGLGAITPFVGGGVCYANVSVDATAPAPVGTFLDDSDSVFAWNATVGLAYAISENTTFELSYRRLQLQDVNLQGNFGGLPTVSENIANDQVNLGVRVKL